MNWLDRVKKVFSIDRKGELYGGFGETIMCNSSTEMEALQDMRELETNLHTMDFLSIKLKQLASDERLKVLSDEDLAYFQGELRTCSDNIKALKMYFKYG